MTFRELLEKKNIIKVKKEIIIDLPKKMYGSTLPLCKKIDSDISKVCDLIDKEGYYILTNAKSYVNDAIISPSDLAKIPDATSNLNQGSTVKIGRSSYYMSDISYSLSSKLANIVVTSDEVLDDIVKSKQAKEALIYKDANLYYGFNLAKLTRDIADSSISDGKFGAYFNKSGKAIIAIGVEGSINTKKPSIFWYQQHSAKTWDYFNPNTLEYKKVPVSSIFAGAFKKSANIDKSNIFVLK